MTESTADSEEPKYTIDLNGKRYELNEEIRRMIVDRAKQEYRENEMFSAWWKVASPEQYESEEMWEETVHDPGDPVLVIETQGVMVPWEKLDRLDIEMEEPGEDSQFDGAGSGDDNSGMKMIDPEDTDMEIGRTHFSITPQDFEETPSPDGEDPDKIPEKPQEVPDGPTLVAWIPEHPDVTHTWGAGEAIIPTYSRVEWNVQKKAEQPRLTDADDVSDDWQDHWESLCRSKDCEVVAELSTSQGVSSGEEKKSVERAESLEGTAGGDNWRV